MTEHEQNTILLKALEDIRDRVMQHPLFDEAAFQNRDIEGLAKAGGDVCDWTMIAIMVQDALNNDSELMLMKHTNSLFSIEFDKEAAFKTAI